MYILSLSTFCRADAFADDRRCDTSIFGKIPLDERSSG
jgi:hypothetical protein